ECGRRTHRVLRQGEREFGVVGQRRGGQIDEALRLLVSLELGLRVSGVVLALNPRERRQDGDQCHHRRRNQQLPGPPPCPSFGIRRSTLLDLANLLLFRSSRQARV